MDIGQIKKRSITDEMEESYLDYAMSVIVSRALPDVRDGLKPVHRRILYAMHELGLSSSSRFRKSAAVVGEVLAKFHPHGDTAVYDSMVRMAQEFSLRYPMVKGQGNFGSMDGDRAAAMRYCLTGDTLILTDQGIVPIKTISNEKESSLNLKVLNYQGKKVKASKFFNSGKHKIIEIVTEQGYKLRGSYNHPVLCWNLNQFGFPNIEWKLLAELKTSDYVILNRAFSLGSNKNLNLKQFYPKNPRYKKVGLPESMNNDLAFLLGALTAEGSFHQGQILFSNKDLEFYNKVKKIIKSQFKGITLYERKVKGDCWELSLYRQRAVKFLENIGLKNAKSAGKEIPFSVLSSKQDTIRKYLIGLFEGDGSVILHQDKRHGGQAIELAYNSKSQKLIEQLKILLLNFGIVTTYPYQDKRNQCYKLLISGVDNIEKFKAAIGFSFKKKKDRLAKVASLNSSEMSKTDFIPLLNDYLRANYSSQFVKKNNFDRYNNLIKNYTQLKKTLRPADLSLIDWLKNNHYFFNKIKTVNKLKDEETVYSVKVESNCHSFIANGFINHNTEAKLSKIAEEMLTDINKETVDWVDNYDATKKEPVVLPAKLPQLLLNGVMGIAVGMATNIPPHNLGELVDAIIHLIANPKATSEDLCQFVLGPDFPTGGQVYDKKGMIHAYSTGKGPMVMRAKTEIVEKKAGQFQIIISEMTYGVNKAEMIQKAANLVKDKKIEGIKDIRDESDKDGVRVVFELKNDAYPKKILNRLFKLTDLQKTFHLNMLALVDGLQPHVLSLKAVLEHYIKHRQNVVIRRAQFELKQAKERAHILEGLSKALDHIDAVIKTIKESATRDIAHQNLMKKFKLSDLQTTAILEMRLQTLAGLEQKKIKDELKEKQLLIKQLEELLKSPKKILGLIKTELLEIRSKYADERRTKVFSRAVGQMNEEELIPQEECFIILTAGGYIKRVNPKSYKAQKRGGKGIIGITPRQEDVVKHFLSANTLDSVLFFTNSGRVFYTKAYEIPETSRTARGQAIVNILQLSSDETISAVVIASKKTDRKYLLMTTKNGIIKKTKIEEFDNVRRSGLIAIKLEKGDSLDWANSTSGSDEVMIVTAQGQSIRFKEKDVRPMGRTAAGVRGIKLHEADEVIGMNAIAKKAIAESKLLIVTENGYGKRTDLKHYKVQKRGGSGIKTAKVTAKTGQIVGGRVLDPEQEDLIVISRKGQVIRTQLKDISSLGRATQGVRIMKMSVSDKVASIACI